MAVNNEKFQKHIDNLIEKMSKVTEQPDYDDDDIDTKTGWICPRCGNSNSPQIYVCICSPTVLEEGEDTHIDPLPWVSPWPYYPWVPPAQPFKPFDTSGPWTGEPWNPGPTITYGSSFPQSEDEE